MKETLRDLKKVAPVSREFAKMNRKDALSDVKGKNGYRISPLEIRGKVKARSKLKLGLPRSYDLRDHNKMTPVRDQGPNGSCWAFAAYGSLESTFMPEYNDFSEKHMRNTHGYDWSPEDGGNRSISTAYLARWSGPVRESDDPYDPYDFYSRKELPRAKDIMKAVYIPDVDGTVNMDLLKQAIMKNGAVESTIQGNNQYFNKRTNAHYNPGVGRPNHAITIAGWDDNFSRNNFLQKPRGDGAWLVKNSWGPSFGKDGYYWVSYYDVHIAKRNVQYIGQNKGEFKDIYQHDWLGMTTSVGGTSGYFANVFNVGSRNQEISAVGVHVPNNDTNYKLYMVKNYSGTNSFANKVKVGQGYIRYAGYYVLKFDEKQSVSAGTKFAPVVYLTSSGKYTIPLEKPIYDYSSKARGSRGESFVSSNGSDWADVAKAHQGSNVCVKAFTSGKAGRKPDRPDEPDKPDRRIKSYKVSVKTDKYTYKQGDEIYITAKVTDKKGSAVSGADVKIKIGGYKRTLKTNYKGVATHSVRTGSKEKEKVYKLEAKVVVDGSVVATDTANFEIRSGSKPEPEPKPDPKPVNKKSINVSLKSAYSRYKAGSEMKFAVKTTDGDGAKIAYTLVKYKITTPNGEIVRDEKYTSYSGESALYVTTYKNSDLGTYKVKAIASKEGYKSGSKTVTVRLIKSDDYEPSRPSRKNKLALRVKIAKKRFSTNEDARIVAIVKDENGKPQGGVKVMLNVTKPNGYTRMIMAYTNGNGVARASVRNLMSGVYRVNVTASTPNYSKDSKKFSFVVNGSSYDYNW